MPRELEYKEMSFVLHEEISDDKERMQGLQLSSILTTYEQTMGAFYAGHGNPCYAEDRDLGMDTALFVVFTTKRIITIKHDKAQRTSFCAVSYPYKNIQVVSVTKNSGLFASIFIRHKGGELTISMGKNPEKLSNKTIMLTLIVNQIQSAIL